MKGIHSKKIFKVTRTGVDSMRFLWWQSNGTAVHQRVILIQPIQPHRR